MSITVIIPAYNRAHCIGRAIDSVLKQMVLPNEILIIDDGSSDELQAVIEKYSCSYLRLIRHDRNRGASQARNTGIEHAKSEYVAFLDSDDVWHSDKLDTQLAFMKEHKLQACCTNFSVYRDNVLEEKRVYRPYSSVLLTEVDMAWGCFVSPGSTFVCKKELLLGIGGYDLNFLRFEDWDLLLRLSKEIHIGWLNVSLSDIYVEAHVSEKSELQGLSLMKKKFCFGSENSHIKWIILSSYWFHKSSLHYKKKRYWFFLLCVFMAFALRPINNFAIKAILMPKLGVIKRFCYL